MRVAIYARVSDRGSDWSGETSCAAQADAVRAFLRARYPAAVEVCAVEDEFRSGLSNVRPGLQRLLDDCRSGSGGWDVLAVLDLDRLARSMSGFVDVLGVLNQAGRGLLSVRPEIDFTSPAGRFMAFLLVASAEFFARLGAQKTRDKMLHMARQGQWPCGKVPRGYRRAAGNRLEVDPVAGPGVVAVFRAVAAGATPTQVRRQFPGWPVNTLLKTLANPIYAGTLKYADVSVPGAVPALVDAETWRRCQVKRAPAAPRPERQRHDYLLAGLVRCACGRAMSPATCSGAAYYRCSDAVGCPHRQYARADALEGEVVGQLLSLGYDAETMRLAAEALASSWQSGRAEAVGKAENARRQAAAADGQARVLVEAVGSGRLSGAALDRVNVDLNAAIAAGVHWQSEAAAAEAALSAAPPPSHEQVAALWRGVAGSLRDGSADAVTRRAWVRAHVRSVVREPDGSWRAQYYADAVRLDRPAGTPEGCSIERRFSVSRCRGRGCAC
jgi:DNA invertase Pin-like site-specific DNA recombinase